MLECICEWDSVSSYLVHSYNVQKISLTYTRLFSRGFINTKQPEMRDFFKHNSEIIFIMSCNFGFKNEKC